MVKRLYTEYPENYFKIIDKFEREGSDVVIEDNYAALAYVRHDMHRFHRALGEAAKGGDRHAAKLVNIVRDMVLVLEPPHAPRETPAKLTIKVNPVVKAILKSSPG